MGMKKEPRVCGTMDKRMCICNRIRMLGIFLFICGICSLTTLSTYAAKDDYILGTMKDVHGKTMYLLDVSAVHPEDSPFERIVTQDDIYHGVPFLTDESEMLYLIYALDEEDALHLYAYNPDTRFLYPVDQYDGKYIVAAYACNEWPDELRSEAIGNEGVLYAFDCDEGEFSIITESGIQQWSPQQSTSVQTSNQQMLIIAIFAVGVPVGILILIGCFIGIRNLLQKKENQRERERAERSEDDVYPLDADEENLVTEATKVPRTANAPEEISPDKVADTSAYPPDLERAYNGETPVISIRHVTMTFRIITSNVTRLIDYIEMFFKKKKTYREMDALHDVSFDVYKGEVVGIIGHNGAGKSTLLKIVSGALQPTKGEVIVDRSKIQLLTLGTGFDVELTGRENVYLNGSLIGYSKKYLDEHFDEIVAFAELEDFIDEKVKNYSSGMVSRLGFAIATAGDAAEILILDEVLSVGDEFFRKKSLARIKEMIHGGSTVLMVSHGMGTITENCTKAVWIEKGVLKMVGDNKTVCDEYQADSLPHL